MAGALNWETLPKQPGNSVTDVVGFIAAFFFLSFFCFVLFILLTAAVSESCFWTLRKSFPFPLAYVEHLILSIESGHLPKKS